MDKVVSDLQQRVLALISRGVAQATTDEEFDRLARDIFGFQYERCAVYRAYCDGRKQTPQSVTHGTTKNCSFDTVRTSDATLIQWSTVTVPNDTFKIMTTGWALIQASCAWPAGTLVDYLINSPGGFELYQHDAITAFSKQGTNFTVGLPTMTGLPMSILSSSNSDS